MTPLDVPAELVRTALSVHTTRAPSEIEDGATLVSDLGLDPADVVLVLLCLEEIGDLRFPEAELDALRTVGDLVELVRRWAQERITLLPC